MRNGWARTEVVGPVDELAAKESRGRPVWRPLALGLILLVLLALVVAWTQRRPIAADYIARELARRHVHATYTVERIGLHTQRLENLVVGDPRAPDLTARWVEVELVWGLWRPKVALVTARGVRLNARLRRDGRISFGEVDRLLPPPSGLPFRFPDQRVDVADASVRFDTPAGRLGLALEGRGRLSDGFRGRMAAASRGLSLGSCELGAVKGSWRLAIDDLRPHVRGPASVVGLGCGGTADVQALRLDLDATLGASLDEWRGSAGVAAARARVGKHEAVAVTGRLGFDGDARRTRGAVELASPGVRVGGVRAAKGAFDGRYAISLKTGDVALLGDVAARGASTGALRGVAASLGGAGGTPIEPIGDTLAAAVRRAQGAFDADASLRLATGRGYGGARFEKVSVRTRSGAVATGGGGKGLTYYFKGGAVRLDGDFALSGGGFPAARINVAQARPGAPLRGIAHVQAMRVGASRLALGEIRFTTGLRGRTRIDTVATLDGPISNGWVQGLVVPVAARLDARGGFTVGEGCTPARFGALRTGSLRLGPTSLPLCPTGRALLWKAPGGGVFGGAELRAPRFAGMLGTAPLTVVPQRLRFDLKGPSFVASGLAIRLGRPGTVSRVDFTSFTGDFGRRGGVSGRFAGLDGKLANVPLTMSGGSGEWSLVRGRLAMGGAMTVSDTLDPPRFWPLVSKDFRLTLADNRIRAGGWLDDPQTGTRILQADIAHDLAAGRGRALLDVPGIRFDDKYQPEELTRLTTGVIALVKGVLKGHGEVDWGPGGSTSRGTFSTEDMDFAAAFGPVEGLTTRVHFTDLLGLASAPGQLAEVDMVRAGIDVLDGRIRYQLLPGLKVRVEGGRWPFCGGELILEESLLDFSTQPSPKRLTFRVEGLDAALFIQKMEFANISATGTFDGIIPMVFDERGGRIVGGRLVARPQGGTLSYIGELTDKQLGVYGKLAFDALKALQYTKLTIDLNGSLDGEFVAGIELDGVARDPALTVAPSGGLKGMLAGRALGQLARIPFEFNINVRGPFRALIGTMRSLHDPSILIQTTLPELLRDRPPLPPVQPKESEPVR